MQINNSRKMDDVDLCHQLKLGLTPKRIRLRGEFSTPEFPPQQSASVPALPLPASDIDTPRGRRIKIKEPMFVETSYKTPSRTTKVRPSKSILKKERDPGDSPALKFMEVPPFKFDGSYEPSVLDEPIADRDRRAEIKKTLSAPFMPVKTLKELYAKTNFGPKGEKRGMKDKIFWKDFVQTIEKPENYDAIRAFKAYRDNVDPIDLLNYLHPNLGFEYEPDNLTGRKTAGPYRRELIDLYKKFNVKDHFENFLHIIKNHKKATIFEQELAKYVLSNLAKRRAYEKQRKIIQEKQIREEFYNRADMRDLYMVGQLKNRAKRQLSCMDDLEDVFRLWATPHDYEMREKIRKRPQRKKSLSWAECVREEFEAFASPHDLKMIQQIRSRPERKPMTYAGCVREEFDAFASPHDKMMLEKIRSRPKTKPMSYADCVREEFDAFASPHDKMMLEKIRSRSPVKARPLEEVIKDDFAFRATPRDLKKAEQLRKKDEIEKAWDAENMPPAGELMDTLNEFTLRATPHDVAMYKKLKNKTRDEQIKEIADEFFSRATPYDLAMLGKLSQRSLYSPSNDEYMKKLEREYKKRATPLQKSIVDRLRKKAQTREKEQRYTRSVWKDFQKRATPRDLAMMRKIRSRKRKRDEMDYMP